MYEGIDGFLGTRASLMLDVVFLAMFLVVPVMGVSVALVKYRRAFVLHKRLQLALGIVLALAVTAFELDMRINGWRHRAVESPYYESNDPWCGVMLALWVHLVFAVTTAVVWVAVIVRAMRRFPAPPKPGEHSASHIFWARLAAADMFMTALTGWIFYILAFAL